MAEPSQDTLEGYIVAIDAQIQSLIATFPGGTSAAGYTDYTVGAISVKGSQQMEQLLKARALYMDQLQKIPKETADVVSYDIDVRGGDKSDALGDE